MDEQPSSASTVTSIDAARLTRRLLEGLEALRDEIDYMTGQGELSNTAAADLRAKLDVVQSELNSPYAETGGDSLLFSRVRHTIELIRVLHPLLKESVSLRDLLDLLAPYPASAAHGTDRLPKSTRTQIVETIVDVERDVEVAFQQGELEGVDREQIFAHFRAIRNMLDAPAPNMTAIAFILKHLKIVYGATIAFGTLVIVIDQALTTLGLPSAQELMDMIPDELFNTARPQPLPPPPTEV